MKPLLVLLVMALLVGWHSPIATATPEPNPRQFTLGYSAQGRPIEAIQFGNGPRKLVVVGNTHGAPEANTYRLTLALIEHLRTNPALVPPEVRLFLIPTINPDGIAIGWRFDAFGVDLNRNMETGFDACPENDWRTQVFGAYGLLADTGGPYADSQVESRLVRAFLLDAAGAIFLHSNAGLVFPASCEHAPSLAMAEAYAIAAGYRYSRFWPRYTITGGMHDWAGSLGIAAITPELITGDQIEFEQNLAGLLAVFAEPERLLPIPQDGELAGFTIPAPIWRYWRALGGEGRFGLPLGPAEITAEGIKQTFANIRLDLRHELQDTRYYVQPAPLGSMAAATLAYGGSAALLPPVNSPEGRRFEQTGHTLSAGFLAFWERGGGLDVFGLPLSGEFQATVADGSQRTVQYLERAIFAYYPEDGSVRLEPLGANALALEALRSPIAAQSVR